MPPKIEGGYFELRATEASFYIERGARGLRGRPTGRLNFDSPPLILHSLALRAGAGKAASKGVSEK